MKIFQVDNTTIRYILMKICLKDTPLEPGEGLFGSIGVLGRIHWNVEKILIRGVI